MQGTIKIRATTGGIKFEETGDTWFNPSDAVKQYIMSLQKGDKVEYSVDEHNKITFIKKTVSGGGDSSPHDTPSASATDWSKKDLLMALCNAYNGCAEIFKARIGVDKGLYSSLSGEEINKAVRLEALKTVFEFHGLALSEKCKAEVVARMNALGKSEIVEEINI